MHRVPRVLLLAVVIPAMAACAANDGRYPSLQMRPAERVAGTFEPATPPPAPAPMAEGTLRRLGDLEAAARAAHARFAAQAPEARSLVLAGRGADVTDNRWGAAQIALADLDGIRSETAIALGDIDLMFVDATLTNTELAAIERTRSAIVALVAEEDGVLANLRGEAGQ